jgi:large subunit ribosomal protein L30e
VKANASKILEEALREKCIILGSKRTIKAIKMGKAEAVIVATNCPKEIYDDIVYYANLAKVPVYIFKGTSSSLGMACGKMFKVLALAILPK